MRGRVMIAGAGSGCGKTSMVCAILGALKRRGESLAVFKCGPDYIDPMFHEAALGIKSRNLDSYLCGEKSVKYLLNRNSQQNSIAIIEGVMGYYDGIGVTATASSHEIATICDTPVVLVVNPKGRSLSLAAEIKGYLEFMPNNIKAVLLSRVSERIYPHYKAVIEQNCAVPVLGFLPEIPEAALSSRHLGLVTADEVIDLESKINLLSQAATKFINLDALLKIASEAGELDCPQILVPKIGENIRVGIARDKAFCFYYEDNLDLLKDMGAELVPFSPLSDKELPENISGLILGGGYPEVWAGQIVKNLSMKRSIRDAVKSGLPVFAECGSFMALCESLEAGGQVYDMMGEIPTKCRITSHLSHFGYHEITAEIDNLLCKSGEKIRVHEFHYSAAENEGNAFKICKAGTNLSHNGIFATKSLFAGYPHMHFWGNISFAENFIRACKNWRNQ